MSKVYDDIRNQKKLEAEPDCLLDYWTLEILKEIEEAKKENKPVPPHSGDWNMVYIIFYKRNFNFIKNNY
jgi:hypothetical protein